MTKFETLLLIFQKQHLQLQPTTNQYKKKSKKKIHEGLLRLFL